MNVAVQDVEQHSCCLAGLGWASVGPPAPQSWGKAWLGGAKAFPPSWGARGAAKPQFASKIKFTTDSNPINTDAPINAPLHTRSRPRMPSATNTNRKGRKSSA